MGVSSFVIELYTTVVTETICVTREYSCAPLHHRAGVSPIMHKSPNVRDILLRPQRGLHQLVLIGPDRCVRRA